MKKLKLTYKDLIDTTKNNSISVTKYFDIDIEKHLDIAKIMFKIKECLNIYSQVKLGIASKYSNEAGFVEQNRAKSYNEELFKLDSQVIEIEGEKILRKDFGKNKYVPDSKTDKKEAEEFQLKLQHLSWLIEL